MSTLELKSVSRFFGAYAAIENFSLSVPAGSRTAIVGPSGSGKTTLLRLIAGFETPGSGSISLDGAMLADDTRVVPAHRRVIGYVPQDGALFPHMTVAENVGFGLSRRKEDRVRRIDELMEMVSLDRGMSHRWPHELSGGQQQRVALARAMAQSPKLMLLDEPFSALDSGLRASMRKTVAQILGDAGVTAILVTHDQEEALSFGDQLAVIRQGRLVQSGHPKELYLRPADEETALFLGDALVLPAHIEDGWAQCPLGLVQVAGADRRGSARILLRPEQLYLTDGRHLLTNGAGCHGTVVGSNFGGDKCTVTVQLDVSAHDSTRSAQGLSIPIRVSAIDAPEIGNRVCVFVRGNAHPFSPGKIS